jgi:hypothetical protein
MPKVDRDDLPAPRRYQGVMVSSTFTDLEKHRSALIKAIKGQGLTDVAMENDSAKVGVDLIDSSLQMVRDSSAYIGIISRKYGQPPKCPKRNPGQVSITELEFNEALRLERPILLFIMGEQHSGREADFESNASRKRKLRAFRERAKVMGPDSSVHRVYATFDSLEEFKEKAARSVADLSRYLDEADESADSDSPTLSLPGPLATAEPDPIPTAPAFYAEPPYIGSHKFVGRQAQLDVLDDWASAADSHPVLLFEAIGGTGKSMLTWEWTTRHATRVRGDWAGRFWYSFYEKGAILADFCGRALAYITGQPFEDFRKKKTAELGERLLHHLQARPWLLVLDGLERVLVAYHRFDAAQLADEEAGTSDQIAQRDPCAAIRPEDDDILRALASSVQSKILLTTRLTPRVLLNASNQPIPGVRREFLPGLRPADAEVLLRACGVTGNSQNIQSYLQSHCDCHPLVTGVLAGLVNGYLSDRGNFDAWAADPEYGGRLSLANLDLVQKRNHILHAALGALSEKSRQLLATLALLSEAVDYPILSALNPHLPARPERFWRWEEMSESDKEEAKQNYQTALQRREEYERALKVRLQSAESLAAASRELAKTVRDLERRGLLQYDAQTRRYDLHPVVRGVAAGGLRQEEKDQYGRRVVDHFSQQAHSPFERATTLDDVRVGLHIVRTLLQMGRYREACNSYRDDLARALLFNLEAYAEILSLLRAFFSRGWSNLPAGLNEDDSLYLVHSAAISLAESGDLEGALTGFETLLLADLKEEHWGGLRVSLSCISNTLSEQNRQAKAQYCRRLALELAELWGYSGDLFIARLGLFGSSSWLVTGKMLKRCGLFLPHCLGE